MAKTVFDDGNQSLGQKGTKVTAAHLNGFQNHRHDGLDQDGSAPIDYALATGSNTLAVAFTPAITAHIIGLPLTVKLASNNTGAMTIAVNGLAAVPLRRISGGDFLSGDLTAGALIQVVYDGTIYRVLAAPSNVIASDFVNNRSASGYQKIPGGLIIQWGAGTGTTPVTFPITFPNLCCGVVGNTQGAFEGCYSVHVSTLSTSGFTAVTDSHGGSHISGGTLAFKWIAIGY